jgi:hypothetical protein
MGLVLGMMALVGCPMDDDDPPASAPLEEDSPLIGTWEYTSDWGTDAYKIATDAIKYGSGSGDAFTPTFEAKIHEVQYFVDTKVSGMLYIEYTTKKPTYSSYDSGWQVNGGPFDPPGNFTVVMFSELKIENGITSIKLANPYNAADRHTATGNDDITTVTYYASEVSSLAAAKQKFNIDTVADYTDWNFNAQTKVD